MKYTHHNLGVRCGCEYLTFVYISMYVHTLGVELNYKNININNRL